MLALALAAAFAHASPTPPPELPASVYQARRAQVLKALHGCAAVLASQGSASGITEDFRQDGDFFWRPASTSRAPGCSSRPPAPSIRPPSS